MGFPIRKSTDQRVFAPPRSLSQRITSFIACACQGIHQLPLRHLIVLIADAHPDRSPDDHRHKKTSFSRSAREPRLGWPTICPGLSGPDGMPTTRIGIRTNLLFTMSCRTGSTLARAANLFHANDRSSSRHQDWWSRTGSNRRHPACKAGALPAELRPRTLLSEGWWAWEDLNLRPHAYQARALTN